MSDKDMEKPDFSLDFGDDELELTMDDEIFAEDKKEEEDDLLTEDELESLIIGIDEENDILDIPDEEEVLEELKFLDENFLLEDEEDEEEDGEEEVASEGKGKKKIAMPDIDIKYFIMKNRFKLMIGGLSTILLTAILIFIFTRDNKPMIEEQGKVEAVVEVKEEMLPLAELNDETIQELSPLEQLAYYRKKQRDNLAEGLDTGDIEKKLVELEQAVEDEKKIKRDVYIGSLKDEYTEEFNTIKPTLFKATENSLILGFVMMQDDFYDDLYLAIEKAFWKNRDIQNINVNVFKVEDQLKKTHELSIARHEFDAIRTLDQSSYNKLQKMNFIER